MVRIRLCLVIFSLKLFLLSHLKLRDSHGPWRFVRKRQNMQRIVDEFDGVQGEKVECKC